MKLFPIYQEVTNPVVIDVRHIDNNGPLIRSKQLVGKFVRVRPETPQEIFAVKSMDHREDKWAEMATNGGTILTMEAFKNAK